MATRKLARFAGAAALLALGGCAAYPYDDYNYSRDDRYYSSDGPNYYPYYAPGYYAGPTVGFGITYTDRYYYPRHRWHRYP